MLGVRGLQREVVEVAGDELEDVLQEIKSGHSEANLPAAVTQRLFSWMRDRPLRPALRMIGPEGQLSAEDTHEGWVQALHKQTVWTQPFHEGFHEAVNTRLAAVAWTAEQQIARGKCDAAFTQLDVVQIVSSWKKSSAMPPDLLPRAAFCCNHPSWNKLVWLLQKWAGPHNAAYRPMLWRLAVLMSLYKRGSPMNHGSWRLIFVKLSLIHI